MARCTECINGGMSMRCAICGNTPNTDECIDCIDFEPRFRDTPTKPQHGREPDNHELWCPHHPEIIRDGQLGECTCKQDKVKPLAQYLDEYIEHEVDIGNLGVLAGDMYAYDSWRELLEQALDAYQSTENVTIKIERV